MPTNASTSWEQHQLAACAAKNVDPVDVGPDEKLGISRNVRPGVLPIQGVRHLPENGTCGWYIWAGEMSEDPSFFEPIHVSHLADRCAEAMRFLLLPPGWSFAVTADGYDAWFEPTVDLTPSSSGN
jgi:hypothetical protein